MIVTTLEGLQWAQNYCNEINEKYPELQERKTPNVIKVMDLTFAYQTGAQFIQNKLANEKGMLQEKANKEEMVFTINENGFEKSEKAKAYEEAIQMIDEILKL